MARSERAQKRGVRFTSVWRYTCEFVCVCVCVCVFVCVCMVKRWFWAVAMGGAQPLGCTIMFDIFPICSLVKYDLPKSLFIGRIDTLVL